MEPIQLDLFAGAETLEIRKPEIQELIEEIKDVRAMAHNVRKGIFKRHDDVLKEMSSHYVQLHNRIHVLEEEIAQLKQLLIKQVK